MSRKVYYADTPERRRVKQEAILVLRQTRGLIDHELLEKAKAQITSRMERTAAAGAALTDDHRAQPLKEKAGEQAQEKTGEQFEAIDRKKNMATIMKFIEMKADNKAFMHEMKSILQQAWH